MGRGRGGFGLAVKTGRRGCLGERDVNGAMGLEHVSVRLQKGLNVMLMELWV